MVAELDRITQVIEGDDGSKLEIMQSEVFDALAKLKHHKSPVPDDVPSALLQAGGDQLAEHINVLCSKAWKEETIPEEWTRATIMVLPKKGDFTICGNYRTHSLINHMCEVFLLILLDRLRHQLEPFLSEEQAGFPRDRGTVHQILTLRMIGEKLGAKQGNAVWNCFINFMKACDSVRHNLMWKVFASYGVQPKLIRVMQCVCQSAKAAVRSGSSLGDWFHQQKGVRQGDPLSPTIFIIYLERALQKLSTHSTGLSLHGTPLNDLNTPMI